jgi:hypothetical protein
VAGVSGSMKMQEMWRFKNAYSHHFVHELREYIKLSLEANKNSLE